YNPSIKGEVRTPIDKAGPSDAASCQPSFSSIAGELMASQVQSSVAEESSTIRAMLTPLQLAMYLLIISGGPLLALASLWGAIESDFGRLLLMGFAPALYASGYALLAGLLSVPHRWAIQPGRFPRDTGTRLYAGRRLYGACFTSLYY